MYAKNQTEELSRILLNISDGRKLPDTNVVTPYVVLADDAFPLSCTISVEKYSKRRKTLQLQIIYARDGIGRQ